MKRVLRLSGKATTPGGDIRLTFGWYPQDIQIMCTAEEAKEFADTVTTVTPESEGGHGARSITTHHMNLPSYQMVITEIKETVKPVQAPPPPVVHPPVPPPAVPPVPPVPLAPPAPPAPVEPPVKP